MELFKEFPECYSGNVSLVLDQVKRNQNKQGDKVRISLQRGLDIIYNLRELMNTNTLLFGFTLTFDSKKMKFKNDVKKHITVNNRVHKYLGRKPYNATKFCIFPEYHKSGELHYHGVLINSYHITSMSFIKWWRRVFGNAKPELVLKYPVCDSQKVFECDYAESKIITSCWFHYIIKNYSQVGLFTVTNI